jgi:hypothetical protein
MLYPDRRSLRLSLRRIITGGFVMRLWLSEVARCTQRGFFEATAGDCDGLGTVVPRPSQSPAVASKKPRWVHRATSESQRRMTNPLRRVLYRVFRLRPHRLHTMNGGVYEPLAVRIPR